MGFNRFVEVYFRQRQQNIH